MPACTPWRLAPFLVALPLAAALPARAGRPLATDDTATADAGSCQLEAWLVHSSGERDLHLAPACGLMPGLELGAEATRSSPRDSAADTAAASLKWAPAAWALSTAAGELSFGLKLGLGYARPVADGWSRSGHGLLALASLAPTPSWAVHLNLGAAHDHTSGTTAPQASLALVWAPAEPALLFVETQATHRHEIFGGNTRSAGARWWLRKDRLGLDITSHRTTGAPSAWSVGLGWYGLGL